MRSITDPPPRSALAQFDAAFGKRFLLTIDAGEDAERPPPTTRDSPAPEHVPRLAKFQQFCESEGVVPLYFVDWKLARSGRAAEILRGPLAAGKAELGLELHPWSTPPFDEQLTGHNSFAGNLPAALEQAKFGNLRDEIVRTLGAAPAVYRAGRHGVGANTVAMLIGGGVAADSSVRPLFDYAPYGGPDFRRHPLAPYWLDDERRLLELPPTTAYWGLLRRQGAWLYPMLGHAPRARALLARTGLLERIPLTPEGVSVDHAIRAIDMALDDGLPLLLFSFHGPSLHPGHTQYVRNLDDLEAFYDWWRRVFAYLELRGVGPTTVREVMRAVRR